MAVTIGNDLIGTILPGSLPNKYENHYSNTVHNLKIYFFKSVEGNPKFVFKERRGTSRAFAQPPTTVEDNAITFLSMDSSCDYLGQVSSSRPPALWFSDHIVQYDEVDSSARDLLEAESSYTVEGKEYVYNGHIISQVEPTDYIIVEVVISPYAEGNAKLGDYVLKEYIDLGKAFSDYDGNSACVFSQNAAVDIRKPIWPEAYKLHTLGKNSNSPLSTKSYRADVYKFKNFNLDFDIQFLIDFPREYDIKISSNFDFAVFGGEIDNVDLTGTRLAPGIWNLNDYDEIPHDFSVGTLKTSNLILANGNSNNN